jgi:hypothetical protein
MNQRYETFSETEAPFKNGAFKNFGAPSNPFKSYVSFARLLELWRSYEADGNPLLATCAKKINEALQKAPALAQPIIDLAVLDGHADLLEQLMSAIFPLAHWHEIAGAALVPYAMQPFYVTPGFKRLDLLSDGKFKTGLNVDPMQFEAGKILSIYSHILRQFYDLDLSFDYPLIITSSDAQTGLERHHRIMFDVRFVEIKLAAGKPVVDKENLNRLIANPTALQLWYELLPPSAFELHGFAVLNVIDVTDQEILSSVKNDLLEKDALTAAEKFQRLQTKLRALLQRPALKLGLAGIPGAQNLLREHGRKIGQSFILDDKCREHCSTFSGSIYDRLLKQKDLVIVPDLTAYDSATQVEQEIIKQGIKNLLVAPLFYEEKFVGLLELGSPNCGDINAMNVLKLKEIFLLFALAIKRSLDELNDRIEAVIKTQCTAIHPAVEWRFRRAAIKYLQEQNSGSVMGMEPIMFKEVYPLYGVSDIRGSSTLRNRAIRDDLCEQLQMAREIVLLAHRHKSLPYLSQINHRLGKQLHRLEEGLGSGDEMSIIEFLGWEIEPHFEHFKTFDRAVEEKIQIYRTALSPLIGAVYNKRKDYEESVAALNETVCNFIDAEQARAQAMFPHYFEKYKSDGVEHGIYIGAALVEDGKFDPIYLKNIRLWQLMLLCGVARQAEKLKPQLKVPLELAHLILVQNQPLTIRFRYDEKKFDVDGTYNVRYEILKKRIDKAVIKGTRQRLTQPGQIAIVYSHAKEAAEYRDYVDYLQGSGYLTDKLEEFDLEDLQGVHGLRALRVTVNLQASVLKPRLKTTEPVLPEMAAATA